METDYHGPSPFSSAALLDSEYAYIFQFYRYGSNRGPLRGPASNRDPDAARSMDAMPTPLRGRSNSLWPDLGMDSPTTTANDTGAAMVSATATVPNAASNAPGDDSGPASPAPGDEDAARD